MRRRLLLLGIDLFWVAISPFLALFIRDNFAPRDAALAAVVNYASFGLVAAAIVLPLAVLNRGLWRYTSLSDLLRVALAVTAIILLGLFATFAFSRLEDVPRSLPAIQWLVLVACMIGSRLAIRLWQERRQTRVAREVSKAESQNVLLVGVGSLAELYLRSIDQFAAHHLAVVGILASGEELPGRQLRSYKVLGRPEELSEIARELEIHGAPLDRVVVATPREGLSSEALDALLALERSSPVKVDWLHEVLGFGVTSGQAAVVAEVAQEVTCDPKLSALSTLSIGRYRRRKRVFDFVGSAVLVLLLAPVGAVVAALVALDAGLPVLFWQKRPGRDGRTFKLYKFRTMRGAHDRAGNRFPDEARSSRIGVWLRKTRLDELPQLYNILVGEMSFVGPRPLLPCDQPDNVSVRLGVRPGLTGLAQAYGERTMPPNDKNALDLWYIQNASFWLDIKIISRTAIVLLRGERLDAGMLGSARQAVLQWDSRPSGPLPAE